MGFADDVKEWLKPAAVVEIKAIATDETLNFGAMFTTIGITTTERAERDCINR